MKTKNFTPVVTAFGLLALAGDVSAQSAGDWDSRFHKRLYVGLGVGISELRPDTSEVNGVDVIDDSDEAAIFTVGYDFSRRLTAEVQFVDLGTSVLTAGAEIDYTEYSISGLLYLWNALAGNAYADYDGLDLRSGLSLYGRAGLGKMDNSARGVRFRRENDAQFMVGLGVEYALNNGLGIRAEYTAYDRDAKYRGVSLLYRFGGRKFSDEVAEADLPTLPGPTAIGTLPPLPAPTGIAESMTDSLPTLPAPGLVDFDADGIEDVVDSCPDTSPGTPVNSMGCEMFNGVLEGVNFNSNSETLVTSSAAVLDDVIATLKSYPEIRISIHAHTDSQGDADANLDLSRRRALSVVRYLTAQGIGIERLQARAYGENRPIADNSTAEGRLVNRRVEFRTVQ